MPSYCNLDGAIVPEAEAFVPVLDRGFLFGDSIYEVVRTRNGCLFAYREHFERLRASGEALGMPLDLEDGQILRRVFATMAATGNAEHYVRLVVTRGTGTAPSIDLGCARGPLRWVILARPLPAGPSEVRLAIIDRLRNDRRALDPAVKSGNYLNNVLGLAEAKQAGATDCVFLNAEGHVTEASTSNVFVLVGGAWCTPPLRAGILAGVTRALLLAFLRARGEEVVERDLSRHDLETADAVFTTSTLRDAAIVSQLDGRALPANAATRKVEVVGGEFTAWCDARAREVDEPTARALAASSK